MTNASKCLLGLTLALFCNTVYAQQTVSTKAVFATYPSTIALKTSDIASVFIAPLHSNISINFSAQFNFAGTVISLQNDFGTMQTILVKAADNPNTILQITSNINADKTISYSGMIMNNAASEGYHLKNDNGIYTLQKFETNKILEPCSQ